MSGRWLTILAVTGCILLVAFALWQRSRTTRQVREFWGASQASLIQHGPVVRLRGPGDADWSDVSRAPGLIHLRATLVDDRYYQWSASASREANQSQYTIQFTDKGQLVELTIAPQSGDVTNVANGRTVPLIPASRQAVAEYLQQIAKADRP